MSSYVIDDAYLSNEPFDWRAEVVGTSVASAKLLIPRLWNTLRFVMFSFLSKPFWDVISSKHDALVMYTVSSSGLSLLKHKDCQCSADALLIFCSLSLSTLMFLSAAALPQESCRWSLGLPSQWKMLPCPCIASSDTATSGLGAVQRLIYSANSCNSVRTLAVAFANILDLGLHATTGDESLKFAHIYTALCNLVSQPLLVGALPNQRTRLRTVWASLTSNFCIFLCCQGEACFRPF
jgi:hypothetical protein